MLFPRRWRHQAKVRTSISLQNKIPSRTSATLASSWNKISTGAFATLANPRNMIFSQELVPRHQVPHIFFFAGSSAMSASPWNKISTRTFSTSAEDFRGNFCHVSRFCEMHFWDETDMQPYSWRPDPENLGELTRIVHFLKARGFAFEKTEAAGPDYLLPHASRIECWGRH